METTLENPPLELGQIWRYQGRGYDGNHYEILGLLIELSVGVAVFKDLVTTKGTEEHVPRWNVTLPLTLSWTPIEAISEGTTQFKYYGSREDYPEYYL